MLKYYFETIDAVTSFKTLLNSWFNDPEISNLSSIKSKLNSLINKKDPEIERLILKSQKKFKNNTICYRGLNTKKILKENDAVNFNIESWTTDIETAKEYAISNTDLGYIVQLKFNKENVIAVDSFYKKNIYMLNEKEIIMFPIQGKIIKIEKYFDKNFNFEFIILRSDKNNV